MLVLIKLYRLRLNPLKSGPTFGLYKVVYGIGDNESSQSPQIGSYLRLQSMLLFKRQVP